MPDTRSALATVNDESDSDPVLPVMREPQTDSMSGDAPARPSPAPQAARMDSSEPDRTASPEDPYSRQVHGWLEQHKSYPRALAGSGAAGIVMLAFELDRRGRLRTAHVVASSGMGWMDRLALDQLRAAEPFPPAPIDADWRTRGFVVPMSYGLRA